MADIVQLACRGIFRGFRDVICGMTVLYKLYDTKIEDVDPKKEPMSTLARRREAAKVEAEKEKSDVAEQKEPPKLFHRLIQCCVLNGIIFWMSMLIFYELILPLLHWLTVIFISESTLRSTVWTYMSTFLSWVFGALWVLPLFVLSKIVNSLWFQDIADAAYKKTIGKPQQMPSISRLIADTLFSLLVQALFLLQAMLISLLPIRAVGEVISLIHLCLLYAQYSFEYRWFNNGWEVQRRISHIETNWPYYLGFGLPLALLTGLPSSYVVSGCVFSILFPLFIISANEAVQPTELYCHFPLRLFSGTVKLSNAIFQRSISWRSSHGTPHKQVAQVSAGSHSTPRSSPSHSGTRKRVQIQED